MLEVNFANTECLVIEPPKPVTDFTTGVIKVNDAGEPLATYELKVVDGEQTHQIKVKGPQNKKIEFGGKVSLGGVRFFPWAADDDKKGASTRFSLTAATITPLGASGNPSPKPAS